MAGHIWFISSVELVSEFWAGRTTNAVCWKYLVEGGMTLDPCMALKGAMGRKLNGTLTWGRERGHASTRKI